MRPVRPTTSALHLGALWALAFVQPLFGLLGGSAEFFVARGNTTFDIVFFALGYALVPPLAGAALVWAAGRIRRGLDRALQLVLVGLLAAALVLPPLGDALSGSVAADRASRWRSGAAFAVAYARAAVVRTFLTFLSPAPLVFLFFFLVVSPVSDLLSAGEASASVDGPARSSTPIVFVLFDELPVSTLTSDGSIDAERFPNLARFAAGATWYRNATTVADSTPEAVPAQLTGELPEPGDLPTSTHHPRSLFTLFRRSHELAVVEPITDVCPARLCPEARPPVRARLSALADDLTIVAEHLLLPDDLRDGLPAIDRGWLGFGSEAEGRFAGIEARGSRDKLLGKVIERLRADDATLGFARAEAALDRPSARPPLVFVHSSLPHGPSRYLPDGRALHDPSPELSRVRARALDAPPVARRPDLPAARAADAVRGRPARASAGQGASRRPLRRRGDPRHRRPRRVLPRGRAAPPGDGRHAPRHRGRAVHRQGAGPARRPRRGRRGADGRRAAHDRRGRGRADAVEDGRDAGRRAAGGRRRSDRGDARGRAGRAGLAGDRARRAPRARRRRGAAAARRRRTRSGRGRT